MKPVNNYRWWQRHRWTIIASDNDTGDKFIAGDNNTGDKFIAGDKNKDTMEVGSC